MKYARTPSHKDLAFAAEHLRSESSALKILSGWQPPKVIKSLNRVARWLEYTAAQMKLQDELDKPIRSIVRGIKRGIKEHQKSK